MPIIADVSTDPVDPPRFEAITRIRTRQANSVAYAGLATPEQVHATYPDVEPLDRRPSAERRLRRGAGGARQAQGQRDRAPAGA